MPLFETIAYGILLPAVVAGLVQLLAWHPFGHRHHEKTSVIGSAAAFLLALITGYVILIGPPALPPIEVLDWVIVMAAAAAVVGGIDSALKFPAWTRWIYRIVLAVSTAYFVLKPRMDYEWDAVTGLSWLSAMAFVMVFLWWSWERMAVKESSPSLLLLIMLALSGATMILMLSGSFKFGQTGAILTSAVGATWVVSFIQTRLTLSAGASGLCAVALVGLLFSAHLYNTPELPAVSALLIIAALMVPWSGRLLRRIEIKPPVALSIQIIAVLALSALAIYVAFLASPPIEPYYSYSTRY